MLALYNLLLPLLIASARIAAYLNPKIKRGLEGRRSLIHDAKRHYSAVTTTPRILIHVASYGELEQAKPVISALRNRYPNAHIHLTFFSPSGYDNVIGKYKDVDLITYTPFDRVRDVRSFLDIVNPELVLFTRYDVWPNMALELTHRKIPTVLFAATAAESSRRMLPFVRTLNRQVYNALSTVLVISETDKAQFVANRINTTHISVAGDTRFDQVIARKESSASDLLPTQIRQSIETNSTLVFVLGSAWPEDEAIVANTIRQTSNILWIIAPHEPTREHIQSLELKFPGNTLPFSRIAEWNGEKVIIVDSIGKLFDLYKYADIAMIGGGFSSGLHNALEAPVWGVPVIVGPKHQKSLEVRAMIERKIAFEVTDRIEFATVFNRLANDSELRSASGRKAKEFVQEQQGATKKIVEAIQELI